jgi:hypothetical protein
MTNARKRLLVVAAAAVAAVIAGVVLVAAHGGNASSSAAQPSQAQTNGAGPLGAPSSAAREKFRRCMEANGVTLPSQGTPPSRPNFDDPTVQSALQACRQYLPARPGGGGFGPPGARQDQAPST